MIFLLPWDVPTPLPLALPGEDTRRGTCATAAAHLSQENTGQQQGVMLLWVFTLVFLIGDCLWAEAASWWGGGGHLWARLLLSDVQLCCLPWANTGLHTLRFGPCCSSSGIFQAFLGPFIQQLFFLLWFLALGQRWCLPQLYNRCEPHRSTELLLTVFLVDGCKVSDWRWGPVLNHYQGTTP